MWGRVVQPPLAGAASKVWGSELAASTPRRPPSFLRVWLCGAVQDGGGNVVGEVHQRWHLWRRLYDLYIGGWVGGAMGLRGQGRKEGRKEGWKEGRNSHAAST